MLPNFDKILLRVIVILAIMGFLAPLVFSDGKHDKNYEFKRESFKLLENQTVSIWTSKIPVDIYAMREPFSSAPLISYSSLETTGAGS